MNIEQKLIDSNYDEIMGLSFSEEKSIFRVFSPPNDNLKLRIYEDPYSIRGKDINMIKNEFGIFELEINENLEGKYYTYVTDDGLEVTDPYSFASSINSKKSAVINLKKTNPEGFEDHSIPNTKVLDATIYEVHVKDFTYNNTSGVENKGKFKGFVEENTSYNGVSTGIDHLKELGITHVHLLPIYDYLTVNEYEDHFHIDENYNWGYDPELYNVPEGSYSTLPTKPENRIIELKEMIQKLHENGIKVVMDVVYNHLFRGVNSNFETLYPGYYLRYKKNNKPSDGAGVGTEMDSQRYMYRKFIIDSIKFWMEEYKIDGFRFDLMGLIDTETMYKVVKTAKEINEDVLIYGEPWTGGKTTLSYEDMTLKGSQRGMGFACFNDTFRDCIKGDNNGKVLGFAMGDFNKKICVESGVTGSINFDSLHYGFTSSPTETINYTNSHDDLILTDKINLAMKGTNEKDKISINKLCHSIVYLSFGIPFIHGGNEFLRTKRGIRNTYCSPISINGIDWSLKHKNIDYFNYFKDLISLRKEIKAFSTYSKEDIKNNLAFIDLYNKPIIGYFIKDLDDYKLIFLNSGIEEVEISKDELVKELNRNFNKNYEIDKLSIEKIFDKNGLIKNKIEILDEIFTVDRISAQVYKINIRK